MNAQHLNGTWMLIALRNHLFRQDPRRVFTGDNWFTVRGCSGYVV